LQLDRNLLQRDNSDRVSALESFAKPLYATLLLALDVGGRLVYRLFQQAGRRCCAFLQALELDFLDDGSAIAVGRDDGRDTGLTEEWLDGFIGALGLARDGI
jgi:hypothetical protein